MNKVKHSFGNMAGLYLLLLSFVACTVVSGNEVPWRNDCETVVRTDRGQVGGWSAGDPLAVAMTIRDGILSLREVGKSSYAGTHSYISYDLDAAPYLKIQFLDGKGYTTIGNASAKGRSFSSRVQGPGLYSVDLRSMFSDEQKRSGKFALSFMVFGPDGREPGDAMRLDWIEMTDKSEDHIAMNINDGQAEGQAGHGVISVGDVINLSLLTSDKRDSVLFKFIDARTGKPITMSGKTEFPAVYDPDRAGNGWDIEIPIDDKSDLSFTTRSIRKGRIQAGAEYLLIVAESDSESDRLITASSWGADFTIKEGTSEVDTDSDKNLEALLHGKVLLSSDFNKPSEDHWRILLGTEWVYLRGAFGDMSDSMGEDELGNWAFAGESWWTDYQLAADMVEELDGAGSVFLAVRFVDSANYYALEWDAGRSDTLRLVRCKAGHRYEIASSSNHDLSKFPFRLAISVSGDYLTGYLNGQPVVSGAAGDFDSGPVALGGLGRKVLVDNVEVTRIVSAGRASAFHRSLHFEYALTPRYFLRSTGKLDLPFILSNDSDETFEKIMVSLEFTPNNADPRSPISKVTLSPKVERVIEKLAPGKKVTINCPIDTRLLRAGEYVVSTRLALPRSGMSQDEVIPIGIARDWNPERFNYFTWGFPRTEAEIADYVEHGHTTGLGGGRGTPLDWQFKGLPVPDSAKPTQTTGSKQKDPFAQMDLGLKYGMIGGSNLQPTHGKHFPTEVYGQGIDGKRTYLPVPYAPEFHDFSVNFASTKVKDFGAYQSFRLMNINSETEGHNRADISERGLALARKSFGGEPPEICKSPFGFPHSDLPGLAVNGIVDDQNEVLRFYRWFWLQGEGYNTMARDMAEAVHKIDPDMLVFHDPAERMPFIRDRMDGLDPWDWTYATPNAHSLAYKIEVLRAMAKPPHDTICNYVQVLWKKQVIGDRDLCPSATMIRLGLLMSASRPVYAVGHWNTRWMTTEGHRDRWEAVKDLSETFWKPLGPVLNNLREDTPRDVAFMVSYTTELFAEKIRGKWAKESAYSAWHEAFMRAGVPVDIVFEEDVTEGKLSQYKSLFIPFGELISRSAYEKIVEFSKAGGMVVADSNLGYDVPGVKILDSDMNHMKYPNWAWMKVNNGSGILAVDRLPKMWTAVNEISRVFAEDALSHPQSDNKWLVVNGRVNNGVTYVYAVNDHRSAGAIGREFGTVLEQGEPLSAGIRMEKAANVATVYDLTIHRKINFKRDGDAISWVADYAPASAKLFALLPTEIKDFTLTVPKEVKRGEPFSVKVSFLDADKKNVHALLPVRLTIKDSQGSMSEFSDTFAAKKGVLVHDGWIAINDKSGTWSVKAEDLASGRSVTKYFSVVD